MDAISDVSRGSEIFSSVPTFPPLPQPLNLDDLFGFSEAARKKLIEEPVETKYFVPEKVFINHVDSFTGKYIVSLLSNLIDEADKSETKEVNLNEKHNSNNVRPDRSPSALLKETIEDVEGSIQGDGYPHDTSKLTVAEYYDMMELETLESRDEFLNEKLGKFYMYSNENALEENKHKSLFENQSTNSNSNECEFQIIGTLKNRNTEPINGVKEIIYTSHDDPEFLNQLVTCGIIIYCVNEELDELEEATWAFNSIIGFINKMNNTQDFSGVRSPIFILVSTFMTWTYTKPLSLNEELPFIETDYRKRKPHPNYEALYGLEEQIVKTQSQHVIRSAIIVSGILYGYEENELRYLFEKAYCYTHVPIYSSEKNLVPLVHVDNLGRIVKETLKRINYVTTPFIFAKDPVQMTLAEVSKVVSLGLGTGFCELQNKEAAFINDMVSQDVYNKITSSVYLESCYPLFKEEDIHWKYESGFTENVNHIVKEFIDAEEMKPLRIILYGVSKSNRLKNIAQRLSEYCHIPYVDPKSIIYEHIDEVLRKLATSEDQNLNDEPQIQTQNLLNVTDSSPKLILGGEEKCLEVEVEILRKLDIHSTDDAEHLSDSDKASLIARKINRRPYVYHGYIMEEYPKILNHAIVMFSEKNAEILTNPLIKIPVLPDFVIFFKRLKDTMSAQSSQQNASSIVISKTLDDEVLTRDINQSAAVDREENDDNEEWGMKSPIQSIDTAIDTDILPFFSSLDKKCAAVTVDFKESDTEEDIFIKTLNVIQRNSSFLNQGTVESSSVQFQTVITTSEAESVMNKITQNSNSEDDIENQNFEECKEAEEITLAVKSYPLLSYMINFISPTLTKGILEVATQLPEDPVDFLAEYIFKNNNEGRMMPQNELKLEEMMRNQKKTFRKIDSKACFA